MSTKTTAGTNVTPTTSIPEKAVSYAALILADADITITPERLQNLLKAANIDDVQPIWTTLFAKALKGKDLKAILTTIPTCGQPVGDKPYNQNGPEMGEESQKGSPESDNEGDQCDSDSEEGLFDLFG